MSFLLAHLSDAHIGPIPRPNLAELLGKRATGYVNWLHKRAAQHDMPLLARLVDDLLAQKPDHVAMTGDIVNIGLSGEIALAREWLGRLGAPEQVSFSPGNHDAYVPRAMALLNETFAPWSRGDDGAVGFPYLRRRGGVALIGLSSGVPTAPFVASGRLGAKQCADLAALLERTEAEGLARVVLLHHPPHRGGARALRGLDDAGAFEDVIAARMAPNWCCMATTTGRACIICRAHAERFPSWASLPPRRRPGRISLAPPIICFRFRARASGGPSRAGRAASTTRAANWWIWARSTL